MDSFIDSVSAGSDVTAVLRTPTPLQDMRAEIQSMIDANAVLVMATSTCPFCIEVHKSLISFFYVCCCCRPPCPRGQKAKSTVVMKAN